MKAHGKILKSVLIVVVVVLLIIIGAFFLLGDYLIKVGVEKGGSAALGVPVKVGSVHLSILRGLVTIDGLQVANPPGYKNEYLLELNKGKVQVGLGSLLSDTIHVNEINLDGTKLAIEQKGLTSNVKELLNAMSKGEAKGAPAPVAKPEAEAPGKKLVVDKLEITNTEAKLAVIVGEGAGMNLKLAPIRMENLGADRPMSIAELTSKIFLALIQGVAQQGAGLLPDDVVSGMKGGLNKITELGGEGGKQVIEEGSKAIEGIKGLFKPKK